MSIAEQEAGISAPRNGWIRRYRWPLMLAGPLVIAAVAIWLVLTSGRFESTDNAYVQVAKAPVSASIPGRVIEIAVKENQRVTRGQVLFRLDPDDVEAAVREAEAKLAAARVQVATSRKGVDEQLVAMQTAQRQLEYAAREAARQRALVEAGVASRQQADQAAQSAVNARQQVAQAREQLAQARINLADPATGRNPAVLQAEAELARARLAVEHTVIVAPTDGIVARVEQLQVGAYVNPSQTVFYLLSGQPWIEANFKENQLARMRVGQPAKIKIDAFSKDELTGHLASFAPGTGAAFSALPAQNATGNWVKVVQRLPVRIAFDKPPPEMAARAGLSAQVTVDVRRPGQR